jgi:hypothetical protein
MEETKVKKMRVRRPKEGPPFYQTNNSKHPTLTTIKVNLIKSELGEFKYLANNQLICPYTEFVPIYYFNKIENVPLAYKGSNNTPSNLNVFKEGIFKNNKKIPDFNRYSPSLLGLMRDVLSTGGEKYYLKNNSNLLATKVHINTYLKTDSPYLLPFRTNTNRLENAIESFSSSEISILTSRSWSSAIGMLSLIEKENPYILAVVAPKDLMYQKLHILIHGTIDLKKVIILVDRRLDLCAEDDIPAPIKALYTRSLKPIIESTNATIFKVPLDFIKSKCFIPSKLEIPKKLDKRNEVIKSLIEGFYKSLNGEASFQEMIEEGIKATRATPTPSVTIEEMPIRQAIAVGTDYTMPMSNTTTTVAMSSEEQVALAASIAYHVDQQEIEEVYESDEIEEEYESDEIEGDLY